MSELARLSACAIAHLTKSRQISVTDIAIDVLRRIDLRDAQVEAWAHVARDLLLEQATALDQEKHPGALHGVPVGVKDVFHVAGTPTAYGRQCMEMSATEDAALVAQLRAAGALIVGKTVTTELAASNRGAKTKNPHDPTRTPGGSSSGSAAAVADAQVAVALGTQTGGSIIRPASYCGVYGLKPTWGSLSLEGVRPHSTSCDTAGFFARSLEDIALLSDVLWLGKTCHGTTESIKNRVAVWLPKSLVDCPTALQATQLAVEKCRACEIEVEELRLPFDIEELEAIRSTIMTYEAGTSLLADSSRGRLSEAFEGTIERRRRIDLTTLAHAYAKAAHYRKMLAACMNPLDAIVAPSAPGVAPEGLTYTGSSVFNAMWTFLHPPVLNVPMTTNDAGLPIGVSFIGRRYGESALFNMAARMSGH